MCPPDFPATDKIGESPEARVDVRNKLLTGNVPLLVASLPQPVHTVPNDSLRCGPDDEPGSNNHNAAAGQNAEIIYHWSPRENFMPLILSPRQIPENVILTFSYAGSWAPHCCQSPPSFINRAEDERRGLKTVAIFGGSDHIVVVPKDFAV